MITPLPTIKTGVYARRHKEWTVFDGLLYAVGVGAGTKDFGSELEFTTENSQGVPFAVLPTFGLVMVGGEKEMLDIYELSENNVLLMSESIRLHEDMPSESAVDIVKKVVAVEEHRRGLVVSLVAEAIDRQRDRLMFETRSRLLIRDPTALDASRKSAAQSGASRADADRSSDHSVRFEIPQNQALVYRLSAGRNPLHSDPAAATQAGYEAPILHGRCTLGFCAREILAYHRSASADAQLSFIEAKFAAPVWPGEVLIQHFFTGSDRVGAGFDVRRADSGQLVMAGGTYELRGSRNASPRA